MAETPCDNLHDNKLKGNSLDNRRMVPKQMAAQTVAEKPYGKHLTFLRRKLQGCHLGAVACWGRECERHGYKGWPFAATGGATVGNQPESVMTRSPHSSACPEGCWLHREMGKYRFSWLSQGQLQLRSLCHK